MKFITALKKLRDKVETHYLHRLGSYIYVEVDKKSRELKVWHITYEKMTPIYLMDYELFEKEWELVEKSVIEGLRRRVS